MVLHFGVSSLVRRLGVWFGVVLICILVGRRVCGGGGMADDYRRRLGWRLSWRLSGGLGGSFVIVLVGWLGVGLVHGVQGWMWVVFW
jgi:hypothetical protein